MAIDTAVAVTNVAVWMQRCGRWTPGSTMQVTPLLLPNASTPSVAAVMPRLTIALSVAMAAPTPEISSGLFAVYAEVA
jgi:hypothetical protein